MYTLGFIQGIGVWELVIILVVILIILVLKYYKNNVSYERTWTV